MTQRILITGAGGFVGRALVDRFADAGHAVIATDIKGSAHRSDVRFITLDVRDGDAVAKACAGVDVVIHNASLVHTSQNCQDMVWAVNLDGTVNVLNACEAQPATRLVYISSASAVYEGKDIENGDETLPYSRVSQAPYADSKIAAEQRVLEAATAGRVQACAIRPHVVFGPGDTRFIPAIVNKARQGRMNREIGDRTKLSDFTYISNLVDGVQAAVERLGVNPAVNGQAYFVTNGEPMAFFEFVDRFLVEMGYPAIKGSVPYWLAYAVAAVAEGIGTLRGATPGQENGLTRFAVQYMNTHHYYSIKKAERDLGYRPAVSIDEGIRLTALAWRDLELRKTA